MESLGIAINVGEDRALADEVYFLLGMIGFKQYGSYYPTKISPWIYTNDLGDVMKCSFKADNDKEITLPELRDMVVLKRNDVGDATHEDGFDGKYRQINNVWYWFNIGKWKVSEQNWHYHNKLLKPIEKTEMKEYLVKSQDGNWCEETTLTGDPADTVIEIPAGAEKYIQLSGNNRYFYKNGFKEFWYSGKWLETAYNDANLKVWSGFPVLWQRETLNDQVASAEEFKQPEDLPFMDDGIDIVVENLPDFTPEFPSEKEIKTDFPLNKYELNHRVAKAFNAVRGTDLTEDDLDFIRKLIDLTVSHYGV